MTITYNGATAGSTVRNPPIALLQTWNGSVQNSPGLTGGRIWYYSSTNVASDLTAPGAIADGVAIGMRPGDMAFYPGTRWVIHDEVDGADEFIREVLVERVEREVRAAA